MNSIYIYISVGTLSQVDDGHGLFFSTLMFWHLLEEVRRGKGRKAKVRKGMWGSCGALGAWSGGIGRFW